jgi:P-type Ca2+ transporter type 2C
VGLVTDVGPRPIDPGGPAGGPSTTLDVVRTAAPGDVYDLLGSGPAGLSPSEARARLDRYGRNVLATTRRTSTIRSALANFTHFMALLLWIAGAVAFAAGLPQLGVAIWVVNVVNGLFAFWQEHKAEQALAALKRLLPTTCRVIREGAEHQVETDLLVPGDVVMLAEGDRISADARVVEAAELKADQSTVTGESTPVRKSPYSLPDPDAGVLDSADLVFAGTSVVSGHGKAVVFSTGMATQFGRIAELTGGMEQERSPLQQELRRLSIVVGVVAMTMGAVFFVAAQLLTPMALDVGFVFTLGMIVAFVPEGLLPTVTLALALATQRMARRNALVKRLSAVETLGSTTVICTDKTGTLTQNEMTVRIAWVPSGGAGTEYRFAGAGYVPEGEIVDSGGTRVRSVTGPLRELLVAGASANNARLVRSTEGDGRWTVLGDPTEGAMKVAALKAGIDPAAEERAAPRLLELPFDSVRKRMATGHATGRGIVLYVKGAPLELLARCTEVQDPAGARALDEDGRRRIAEACDRYSRQGLRVLAVATRLLGEPNAADDPDTLEQELVFLGLEGMLDPPHPEVEDAVRRCRRAGIRTVMMTGDYGLTAESIARRIGLLTADPARIVTGTELDAMGDDELAELLTRDDVVFARVAPVHKLRIVTLLQEAGQVVAVTGDGVNDAPALKRADIGVAMGRTGTDVAKEAADMVLLDDNFASIVNAVEEGRAVYDNIRKFTGYIFTSNTPEAVPFILFALTGGQIPIALGVMHILAVDLGTDLVPALALGSEAPEPGTMDRPPRRRDEHLVTRELLIRSYIWLGLLQAAVVMGAFYFTYWMAGYWGQWLDLPGSGTLYRAATAMALAAVVTTQIGNLFAHRTAHESIRRVGWTTNRLAFVGIASELAVILLVVYAPPLQAVIGTGPFPAHYWLLLLAAAPLLLVADEIRKALVRRRAHGRRS